MKWIRYFILLAGAILLAAALGRFLVAFGNAQVLSLPEPVLGIPLRYAVLLVGVVELAVALLCLFGKRVGLQVGCVAWLAVNYLVYRIGAHSMNAHHLATAVGSLTDPLQLTRGVTGAMVAFAPAFLLAGGSASTVWLWLGNRLSNRRREDEKFVKMSCPACGIHIKFEGVRLGQQIDCPKCQKSITLRRSENLKMSCFFCAGHVEFPAHAVGEKLKCPHCHKDITLKATAAT
jgi:hypothetical protein